MCVSFKEGTMLTCTTEEIVQATRAYVCNHADITSISGTTIDSRNVVSQGMFVAFRAREQTAIYMLILQLVQALLVLCSHAKHRKILYS